MTPSTIPKAVVEDFGEVPFRSSLITKRLAFEARAKIHYASAVGSSELRLVSLSLCSHFWCIVVLSSGDSLP